MMKCATELRPQQVYARFQKKYVLSIEDFPNGMTPILLNVIMIPFFRLISFLNPTFTP